MQVIHKLQPEITGDLLAIQATNNFHVTPTKMPTNNAGTAHSTNATAHLRFELGEAQSLVQPCNYTLYTFYR